MTDTMDMYFLDVGQGDCTYLEVGAEGGANQELYLIDFGYKQRQFNGDHPAYQTLEILVSRISIVCNKQKKPPYIDHLFVTHPDGDHWNMIWSLVTGTAADGSNLWEKQKWPKGTTLKIGTLTFGGADGHYTAKNYGWDTITGAAKNITVLGDLFHDSQNPMTGVVAPRWKGLSNKLRIYLINSNYPTKSGGDANPKSLCLIFEFDNFRLMLLGDAEPTTVGDVLQVRYPHNNYAFLRCDVLKLAHHGSRKGTPPDWPKLVKPKYAFVSGDYYWSHPYQEALANVFAANTLNAKFFNHWVSSYDDDEDAMEKDYIPYQTAKAMFSSLWYVVTSSTPVKAENQKGVELTYGQGQYIGIAWLLQKIEGQTTPKIAFSPDDVWPRVGVVPS
jgi:competence protein ComEC